MGGFKMDKRKFGKKLILKRETISNLGGDKRNIVAGCNPSRPGSCAKSKAC